MLLAGDVDPVHPDVDDRQHRRGRGLRVACLDGVDDGGVAVDGRLVVRRVVDRRAVGEGGDQRGLDDAGDGAHQRVAGGAPMARWKSRSASAKVWRVWSVRAICRTHSRRRAISVGRAPLRGEGRGGGLDRAADLGQALHEVIVEPEAHAPGEHVGIEVVPVHRVEHARADPGLRDHEAFGGERLHDLAHHGARDLEALDELRLRRHVGAGGIEALEELRAEDGRDLIVAGLRPLQRQPAQARHGPRHRLAIGTILRLCVHGADGTPL